LEESIALLKMIKKKKKGLIKKFTSTLLKITAMIWLK